MVEVSALSRRILRDLCTDSRITITEIADRYKISRHQAKERIAALENYLGIRYTLELNYSKLGFESVYVQHATFKKKPKASEVRELIKDSRVIQFAATTKGDFDLIMYVVAKDPREYFNWEIALWMKFAKYSIRTYTSEVIMMRLGFVPLNNELLKDSSVDEECRKILMALNKDSRLKVRELSKEVGMREDLARYYLKKLEDDKVIKRYTAIVTKPPFKHNLVYFVNYSVAQGIEKRIQKERKLMYLKEEPEVPIVNDNQAMFSMTGHDSTFEWAIGDDAKMVRTNSVELHSSVYKDDSPEAKSAELVEIIKGELPIRNIDVKATYDTYFEIERLP